MMSNHDKFWHAIEVVAIRKKMTCSGLARFCGLDATTFNKSKRFTRDGKPRWLSVGTVDKMLSATGTSLVQFAKFCQKA